MRLDVGRAARGWLVAAFAVAIALGATAASRAAVTYFGLTFPDRVAGATLGPVTDFEKDHPGLGYGVRYQQQGWAIDVYIYDDGIKPIPDDLGAEVHKKQIDQAQGDIFEMQKSGRYSGVKLTRSHVIKDRSGRTRFLCRDFTFAREKTGKVDSYLCLTGWNNKFVKFRLTTLHRADSAGEAKRFMDAWIGVLWP